MRNLMALIPLFLTLGTLQAQMQSNCADCHIINPDAPAPGHLSDWEHSAHGRNQVGCESCHGGDASTFESFLAHREILASRNPASPVHRRNLPATCGRCHTGQFVAFQRSQHFALLQQGDERTPVCTTCHGDVAAYLLSPRALAGRCASCHGEEGIVPRPGRPELAREMLEGVMEVRSLLDSAEEMLRHVRDAERREALEEAYHQAEIPLSEAIIAGHSFVYDQLQDRLGVARRRATALLEQLVNSEPQ